MLAPEKLTLVAITDDLRGDAPGLVARAQAAARGGATMIQLRLKDADARTLVEVARALIAALPHDVPLIVNDRADVAIAAGAAGVHVGDEDVPPAALRRVVPRDFIIGASVGTDAEVAFAADADYVGIGPVYATDSKHDAGTTIGTEGLAELVVRAKRPAVAIGGIDATNAAAAVMAGATGVAAIRAIFGARDPEQAARTIRAALGR
jgi:thiamine-phosphate pyrophosphorylase